MGSGCLIAAVFICCPCLPLLEHAPLLLIVPCLLRSWFVMLDGSNRELFAVGIYLISIGIHRFTVTVTFTLDAHNRYRHRVWDHHIH